MSQPPPPPNQPPPGGFDGPKGPSYGYPQQPDGQPSTPPPGQPVTPPSGYGYPQSPPPGGSGYGYPQTPPPGAGSYGYPQTPPPGQPPTGPNPYATGQAGPNPYSQPPFGQPPTAPMPAAGPQGGGGNKKIMVILAAVVAVAVIAVGTVFVFTRDGSDDESKGGSGGKGTSQGEEGGNGSGKDTPPDTVPEQDGEAEIAWEGKVPRGLESDRGKQAHGVLFHSGNIVKYEPDGLVAYNIKTGKEVWKEKFPRGDYCGISTTTSDGKALVQWGAKCEKVMGFDIAKGKKAWEKDLPGRNGEMASADQASLAISGDLGGIAWIGGRVGFRMSDGKELWSNTDPGCADQGYAGGEQFLALQQCLFGSDGKLRKLDQDGEKAAEWKVPKGVQVKRIFSTSPIVVGLAPEGITSKLSNIAVLSDDLKLTKRIKIDPERYNVTCQPSSGLDTCHNVVVDKDSNMLFMETETYEGKERRTNAIVGYDLKSGAMKWTEEPTEEGRTTPVAMHDGKLLAMEQGSYDAGGGVTQLDPKKGNVKPFLEFSADEREKARDYGMATYWADNTLFLAATRLPSRIDDKTNWLVAIR